MESLSSMHLGFQSQHVKQMVLTINTNFFHNFPINITYLMTNDKTSNQQRASLRNNAYSCGECGLVDWAR